MSFAGDNPTSQTQTPPFRPYRHLKTLEVHTRGVSCVKFSNDGSLLASASLDKTFAVFSSQNFSLVRQLSGHSEGISDLAWTADSRYICSASDDKTLRLWDALSGECLKILKGHAAAVFCVSFDPPSRLIASGHCKLSPHRRLIKDSRGDGETKMETQAVNPGWEFTCDFEVDYKSEEKASIVYNAIAVDKELQPDKVKRQMSVSDGKLLVHFEAVEARFLRALYSAFMDVLTLATKTIEEIEPHTFRKNKQPVLGRGNHTTRSSFASVDDEEYTRNNCFVNEFECQSQADNDQVAYGFQSLPTPNTPTTAARWGGYSSYNNIQEDYSTIKQGDFEKKQSMILLECNNPTTNHLIKG